MSHPNNLKLKIVVVLALLFAISSVAYASEVTGNLSSGGSNTETTPPPQNNGGDDGTDQTLSGSVGSPSQNSGGGSSGSSRSNSTASDNGSVLGESTYAPSPDTSSYSYPSAGKLTTGSSVENDIASENSLAQMPPLEENAGVSQSENTIVPDTDEGINMSSWFWIILLLLLLLGVIWYFYRRPSEDMMQRV